MRRISGGYSQGMSVLVIGGLLSVRIWYDMELGRIVVWRRERDSNPRYTFVYGTLAMYWFKPLTHPSEEL